MTETESSLGRDVRRRMYAMMHLGEVCRDIAQLQEDILELSQFPERNKKPVERLAFLRGLAESELVYMEQVVKDLRDTKQQSEKERA